MASCLCYRGGAVGRVSVLLTAALLSANSLHTGTTEGTLWTLNFGLQHYVLHYLRYKKMACGILSVTLIRKQVMEVSSLGGENSFLDEVNFHVVE